MTKKHKGYLNEIAFFQIEGETSFGQTMEDLLDVLEVLLLIFRVDDHIISIHDAAFTLQISEHILHKSLE